MAVETINHPAMFMMKFGYSASLKQVLIIDRKSGTVFVSVSFLLNNVCYLQSLLL